MSRKKPPKGRAFGPRMISSQLRSALTYVLITTAALCLLNFYTASTLRHLAFSAQETSMFAKIQLVSTAMGNLEEYTADAIARQMQAMGQSGMTRVVITDRQGLPLYDRGQENEERHDLSKPVAQALENRDVLHCRYTAGIVESSAAMPVYNNNGEMVGAVCMLHQDVEQGAMIEALQTNILRISIVTEVIVILLALAFAFTYSRRMRRILLSIRTVRQGDYSYRIVERGRDEAAELAREFNDLTSRLQESEERRRQFVSNASHELKTPLASIKLLADSILQNEMDGDTIREFLEDIGDEADRLTRLSQKLLELTKIDSQTEMEQEIVSVRDVAVRVVRMLEPIARQQEITIETDLADGCTVMTAEDDLYQILFNLAENGIKYNVPKGWLKVSASHTADSVIITVADSGVGIPTDAMEHVFERFYRVDKARSRAAGGVGLGLSIVHDMVERNDGSVRVSKGQPSGTVFTVTFPLLELDENDSCRNNKNVVS